MATKKTVAKEEVKATAAKAEVKVEAPKAEVKEAPKAEKKVAPKAEKKVAPKAEKKAAPKAEKKVAPKAEAKTAAKAPAKKAEVKSTIAVQFDGKEYSNEKLVEIAQDVWKYDMEKKAEDFKSVELYVNFDEKKVYFVVNGKEEGSFAI